MGKRPAASQPLAEHASEMPQVQKRLAASQVVGEDAILAELRAERALSKQALELVKEMLEDQRREHAEQRREHAEQRRERAEQRSERESREVQRERELDWLREIHFELLASRAAEGYWRGVVSGDVVSQHSLSPPSQVQFGPRSPAALTQGSESPRSDDEEQLSSLFNVS